MSDELAIRAEAAGAPSANGELVFEEPWQGRALSMAVHLSDAGAFGWDDFRARLIDAIGERPDDPYYVQFLSALEHTLSRTGLVLNSEVSDRMRALTEEDHHHHLRADVPCERPDVSNINSRSAHKRSTV